MPRYAPQLLRTAVLLASALVALGAAGRAEAHHWRPGACGLPTEQPLRVEFAEVSVSPTIRNEIFGPARPALVLASSGNVVPTELRALGAHTVFWQMKLERIVGSTRFPADPASIPDAAGRLAARAAAQSGCATPLIALNELWGAWVKTPWSFSNAQYRANVLTLLTELHARGARPFLLLPTTPKPFTTSPEVVSWWQQVALVSDVVLQVHFDGRYIASRSASSANRLRRRKMRRVLGQFAALGIPPGQLGLLHGFQSGRGFGGREGLPLSQWLRVVKWETLAARQVASEYAAAGTPVGSDWSWGWGDFPALTGTSVDPDKHVTACVFLWARDPRLCDGPGRAAASGNPFNASLTEGQILLPSWIHCSLGRGDAIVGETLSQVAALTDGKATLGRARALTALLSWIVHARFAGVDPAAVQQVEEAIVAQQFGGNRAGYEAALAERKATPTVARALIADLLRRQKIVASARSRAAYERWLRRQQGAALASATCLRDELPNVGVVDLAEFLTFIRLTG